MPKPMHRSTSFKKVHRITAKKRNVVHYRRAKHSMPHCSICGQELNGISEKGGRSRRTNNRIFGGVLCAKCTANIIKLGSRVEQGELNLNDIGIKERTFVLQLVAH
ncbi:MAG: 50S ribosomal protein L34e [Candidatus Micrarchaeia archaeon]